MYSKHSIMIGGLFILVNLIAAQAFGGEPPFGAILSYQPAAQHVYVATPYPFGAMLEVRMAAAAEAKAAYPFGALLDKEMEVSQRRSREVVYPFGDLLAVTPVREPRVASYPFGALLTLSLSTAPMVADNARGPETQVADK